MIDFFTMISYLSFRNKEHTLIRNNLVISPIAAPIRSIFSFFQLEFYMNAILKSIQNPTPIFWYLLEITKLGIQIGGFASLNPPYYTAATASRPGRTRHQSPPSSNHHKAA